MAIVKRLVVLCLSLTFFAWGHACNGGGGKYTMEQHLLDYDEVDNVKFKISGNAVCSKCEDDELPIDAMQIEVYPKDGPMNRLSLRIYDGLGPFSVPAVEAESGQALEVHGTLLREGTSGYVTAYRGYGEVIAPNDDGDTVALTLKFPSKQSDAQD